MAMVGSTAAVAIPARSKRIEPEAGHPVEQPVPPRTVGTGAYAWSITGGAIGGGILGVGGAAYTVAMSHHALVNKSASTLTGKGLGVVVGVLGGLAALAGGAGGYFIQRARDGDVDRSAILEQRRRLMEDPGISTRQLARELLSWYDDDGSGAVSLDPVPAIREDGTDIRYLEGSDRYDSGARRSEGAIFNQADVNRDRVVDEVELAQVMAAYDLDGNGALTTVEYRTLSDDFAANATRYDPHRGGVGQLKQAFERPKS